MKYVYILQSAVAEHFYVGITDNLRMRLAKHNAEEVPHTFKYRPWRVKTYVAFNDEKQAFKFEMSKITLRPCIFKKTALN